MDFEQQFFVDAYAQAGEAGLSVDELETMMSEQHRRSCAGYVDLLRGADPNAELAVDEGVEDLDAAGACARDNLILSLSTFFILLCAHPFGAQRTRARRWR